MQSFSFTWLGHGTFLFRSPGGQRILIDPWLTTNPVCPDAARRIRELDLLLLTHGHDDHTADAVAVGRATGARAIAPYELALWLQHKGLQTVTAMNRGGTIEAAGLAITMVPAFHSSSIVEDGRVVFAMADPYSCKCIYVGDPQAYATYRQRAIHWEVGDEQTQEDMDEEGAGFDRGVWAPW